MSRLLLLALISFLTFSANSQSHTGDKLIHQPFGSDCVAVIESGKLKGKVVQEEFKQNLHDPGLTDTIQVFKAGKNEMQVFRGKYNSFCIGIAIYTKKWKLDNKLQIGTSLEEFKSLFPKAIKVSEGIYRIDDSDKVDFAEIHISQKGKVKEIHLAHYYD